MNIEADSSDEPREGDMNALVIYDSTFGNTEQIARAIADALAEQGSVQQLRVAETGTTDLEGIDLLVLGCPTQRHKPTPAVQAFLDSIPSEALQGLPAAAFGTRYRRARWLTGSAARAIAKKLKKLGASLLLPGESFFVASREGPLEEGELQRAADWAQQLFEEYEAQRA
jgi:flavodoxin I